MSWSKGVTPYGALLTFSGCLNDSTRCGSHHLRDAVVGVGLKPDRTGFTQIICFLENNKAATDSCCAWDHHGITAPCNSDTFSETLSVYHVSGKKILWPLLKWWWLLVSVNPLCWESIGECTGHLISVRVLYGLKAFICLWRGNYLILSSRILKILWLACLFEKHHGLLL